MRRKMHGWLDKNGKFYDIYSEYGQGAEAAEMRYGFDPMTKSAEFIRGYNEWTEHLYPLRHNVS